MKLIGRFPAFFLALFFCAALTACAGLTGAGQPIDVRFRTLAANTLLTADNVVTATRTLLRARKITADDAENVVKVVETTQQGVTVARQVTAASGPAAGMSRLRMAADAIDAAALYVNVPPTKKE